MIKIGLTGGIGSGKSTVARIFEVLGTPVYYSDLAARRLMNEDPELKAGIIRHFGEASYIYGQLNRPYISQLVFHDREKLELLNRLVHPVTLRDSDLWMKQQRGPYAIKEAALIFEAHADRYLDYVIGVYAPEALRIERTVERDRISPSQVHERMKNQLEEDQKMKLSDFIIYNDEEHPVLPQVMKLHEQLLRLA
jgi:dephospho-CoA kinase